MNETENNRIRESLEQIEPAANAKERMLANIRRKAAEQSSENAATPGSGNLPEAKPAVVITEDFRDTAARKASPTRRLTAVLRWAVPAAACLIIAIVGAVHFFPHKTTPTTPGTVTVTTAGTVTPEGGVMSYGPLTTYSSAEELAAATGIRIDAPAGATDVTYESADTDFAQVVFSYGEREYTLRASTSSGDFSGLYGEESEPRKLNDADSTVLTRVRDEGTDFFKLVWNAGSIKSILTGPGDTPDAEIAEVYNRLKMK